MSPGLVLGITAVLVLLGIVGSVLPGLPGPVLIFVAALFEWFFLPKFVSPWTLALFAFLSAFSLAADWALAALGAKAFGGSRWSFVGAPLGALLGLPFGLAGLLIGAVLGAALAEAIGAGRSGPQALKAGFGAALGVLAGTFGRAMIALSMAVWLLANYLMG